MVREKAEGDSKRGLPQAQQVSRANQQTQHERTKEKAQLRGPNASTALALRGKRHF